VDVADSIWYIVSRPGHVNIADLLILASDQASATLVDKKTET
jgi:NADP-dependent 3-hydroxy acid dehydrogenase YdfG